MPSRTDGVRVDTFNTIFDKANQSADQGLSHAAGRGQRFGQRPTGVLQIFVCQSREWTNHGFASVRRELDTGLDQTRRDLTRSDQLIGGAPCKSELGFDVL
jgi:hypothetical protein